MVSQPLVSIVMSMRNAEQTILLAIKSILRQTYSNWELILLDDGSADSTVNLARSVHDGRVHIVADGRSLGLAKRLNQAIKLARGKYIARMDADDVSCPERFIRQVVFLEANHGIDLVGTGAIVFGETGEPVGAFPVRRTHKEICSTPWSGFLLAHPTWMGKREWFLKYGYREDARRAQDQDLLLRAHRDSHFACLEDVLVGYRQGNPTARNIALGRYHYATALWRYGWDNGHYRVLLKGLATQMWRGAVAIVLIAMGQGQHLLGRRFAVLGGLEMDAWQRCWRALHEGDQQADGRS